MISRISIFVVAGLLIFAVNAEYSTSVASPGVSSFDLLVADNPRKDRRDDRQEGRGDNRDDRQDCRDEEGLGQDKRECKREDDDGPEVDDENDEKNA